MKLSIITVSAEFGGTYAAQAVLPHFRALKSAVKGRSFRGFPFAELGFILRVDGEISSYGLSGAGCTEFDRKGQWVSVDIGIPTTEWSGRSASEISVFIARAIMQTVDLFKGRVDDRLRSTDWAALEAALQASCSAYLAAPEISIA